MNDDNLSARQCDLLRAALVLASRGHGFDAEGVDAALDALGGPPEAPCPKLHPARDAMALADALLRALVDRNDPEASRVAQRFLQSPWGSALVAPLASRAICALDLARRDPERLPWVLDLIKGWRAQGAELFILDPLRPCVGPFAWPDGDALALELARLLQGALEDQALKADPSGELLERALGAALTANPEGGCLRQLFGEKPKLWASAGRGPRPPISSSLALAWRLGWQEQALLLLGADPQGALRALSGRGATDPYQAALDQAADPLGACQALERHGARLPAVGDDPRACALVRCAERGPQAAQAAAWLRERMAPQDLAATRHVLAGIAWMRWDLDDARHALAIAPEDLARWADSQKAATWGHLPHALKTTAGRARLARLCRAAAPFAPGSVAWASLASQAAALGATDLFSAACEAAGKPPAPQLFLEALTARAERQNSPIASLADCVAWAHAQGCDWEASVAEEGARHATLGQRALELMISAPTGSEGFERAQGLLLDLGRAGAPLPTLDQCRNGEWAKDRQKKILAQAQALREEALLRQDIPAPTSAACARSL